jgi:hypothetical protein
METYNTWAHQPSMHQTTWNTQQPQIEYNMYICRITERPNIQICAPLGRRSAHTKGGQHGEEEQFRHDSAGRFAIGNLPQAAAQTSSDMLGLVRKDFEPNELN